MGIGTAVTIAILALLICAFLIFLMSGYVKAPPDMAYIISGFKKEPRVLIGRAGIKVPFLERKDFLVLRQLTVDIKTGGYVPTKDFIGLNIDAVAKIQVDQERMNVAMRNFLNFSSEQICAAIQDSLQGNMREIIGTLTLKEICNDRTSFGDEIQKKAQVDMNALGLSIISCNIQSVQDKEGLIVSLGQENMSQIQKDASIAKALAEKDIQIEEAKAQSEANAVQVKAAQEIEERNNQLEIKRQSLLSESERARAMAEAAFKIESEVQRKATESKTMEADIARQEQEVTLRQKEVEVQAEKLRAEIEKTADARAYEMRTTAEAELFRKQKEAEASEFEAKKKADIAAYEAGKKAEAQKAEAEGIKALGDAKAAAISAEGVATAEATRKRAEAMKEFGKAATLEMLIKILPEMAKAIADPLQSIDKITLIGGSEGNESNVVGTMADNVPMVMAKTLETIRETTGVDIKDIVMGDSLTAKTTHNINVSKTPEDKEQ